MNGTVEEFTTRKDIAHRLAESVPIVTWLPLYESGWLRIDLLAGLTAAAVVIPQAMAYATIAGLPVQVGLYTALTPMLIYALLGTSRRLSVSCTSTISGLVATELAPVVQDGGASDYLIAATTLALLVGLFLVLASLLRLGFVANFISLPVLTGFKAGVGVTIFVGQLGKVLGVSVEKAPFLQTIQALLGSLGQIHWPTFTLALLTVGLLIFLPRLAPRLSAPLVAVAVGIAAAALLNMEAQGVKLAGAIPPGLPSFSPPDLGLLQQLWPGALGIALMSFIESIAAARVFARPGDPPPSADQELLALGMANIGGSFFQAYPAGGGTSQTAVADQAGAKSQVAGLVVAGVVVVTLLFLAPLISLIPQATLGALVLVAAARLVKTSEFRAIQQIRWVEFGWALVAFAGVVVLGTLEGILVAVVVSLLVLLYYANHPPVYLVGRMSGTNVFRSLADYPGDETFPGLLLLHTEGYLYFASAPRALEEMEELIRQHRPHVVALDCSAVPNIEYTALKLLSDFDEKLRASGTLLWLAALNPDALQVVERAPLGQALGHDRMFSNLEQAVEAYLA
jgi:high affinity sulfate transporter 1